MRLCDIHNFGMTFAISSDGRESRKLLLPTLVDSILNQGIPSTEIIVVGNNDLAATMPAVRYDHQPEWARDAWVTRLMNRGVHLAKQPLVMMLHDDVVLEETFWKELQQEDSGAWDFLTIGYLRTAGPFRGIPLAYESVQHPRWTLGGPQGHRILNDEDPWDPHSYPSGELLLGWADAFARQRWDNDNNHKITRGSAQAFDVQFGHAANEQGLRFAHRPNIKAWVLEL